MSNFESLLRESLIYEGRTRMNNPHPRQTQQNPQPNPQPKQEMPQGTYVFPEPEYFKGLRIYKGDCKTCLGTGDDTKGSIFCPECGRKNTGERTPKPQPKESAKPKKPYLTYAERLMHLNDITINDIRQHYIAERYMGAYEMILGMLEAPLAAVTKGNPVKASYVIELKTPTMNQHYAETLLKHYVKANRTIFPYVSLTEIQQLHMNDKLFKCLPKFEDYTLEDMYRSDLLCIKLKTKSYRDYEMMLLLQVINARLDRELNTLIFADGPLEALINPVNAAKSDEIVELYNRLSKSNFSTHKRILNYLRL